MKIGITYNLKEEVAYSIDLNPESVEEFDTSSTIDALCQVFESEGYETLRLGSGMDLIERLKNESVDFVFNISEGYYGRNRESHIPSILEILKIPYSGSDPLTLGLTLDKIMAKKMAKSAGIPTPNYVVINHLNDISKVLELEYPLITKPAWEGSSKGIYNASRVDNFQNLKDNVALLLQRYNQQPILVEEYVKGKDVTVGLIGNNNPELLGMMEIKNAKNTEDDFFYSLETKRNWKSLVKYISPPDLPSEQIKMIEQYAFTAFREFGCRDVARIDFRFSEQNRIFFLEINPLPGLSPEYADLVIMARKQGIEYKTLVLKILNQALARYGRIKTKKNIEVS